MMGYHSKMTWALVFIYFYDATPYVETVTLHSTMTECFHAREALAAEVGKGDGYFKAGQQAICINMIDTDA
jgi:hypothetical protein